MVLPGFENNCKYLQQMSVSELKGFQLRDFSSCFQLLAAVIWNKRDVMEVQAYGWKGKADLLQK